LGEVLIIICVGHIYVFAVVVVCEEVNKGLQMVDNYWVFKVRYFGVVEMGNKKIIYGSD